MRGTRVLVATGALLLVLSLPSGSVFGARQTELFVAKLRNPVCTHSGAFHDLGTVDTTARVTERGRHGTNYMILRASFQRRTGGAWHTLASFGPYTSISFANDASNHTFGQIFGWAIRPEDVGGVFRWRVRFQWWDQRPGQDLRIVEKVRLSEPCRA